MARLQQFYKDKVVADLTEKFGYKSVMEVPRLTKITLNMGLSEAVADKKVIEHAVGDLTKIAGQKPVVTKARKAIAGFKIREGWQVWLFGSKKDFSVGEAIRERLIPGLREEAYNLSGETALAEAIDLMSCADAVVSNDSGLMHVAAALNRPLVAVYGSTSPGFTPPLAEKVEVVRLGLDCSPCFDRTCRFGHYNCLRLLEPQRVADALQQVEGPATVELTVKAE